MNKFKRFLVCGLLTLGSFSVQALPITGSLDMGGNAYAFDEKGGNQVNDPASANFIDFTDDQFGVVTAKGLFTPHIGSVGDIKDLPFDPFINSITDFWKIGDFSFDLTGVVRGTSSDPSKFLVLNGAGIIKDSSGVYDDTNATWSFTADTTGQGSFTWNAVSSVPEPGMLALLSIGLIGFGLRRSKI